MIRALSIALLLSVLLAASPAAAVDNLADAILERAMAADSAGDRAGLEKARLEIDTLLSAESRSPSARYAKGWILSHLGRAAEAVSEYDEALRLAPKFSGAAYNAGVVLMGVGRESEAIARFEAAIAVDPDHVDARYNLGQAYYNRREFPKALAAWRRARELAPSDFQAAKKVVQAYHALGDHAGAATARSEAIAVWKASTDPAVRTLTEFVFDQFKASGRDVMASEVFERPEDRGYLYRFRVFGADGREIGSVRLEPGVGFEKAGMAYVIGVADGSKMWTPGPAFASLPDYATLKPLVVAAIAKHLPAAP
jgi:tetratricopeptide (TPR) repeat protein